MSLGGLITVDHASSHLELCLQLNTYAKHIFLAPTFDTIFGGRLQPSVWVSKKRSADHVSLKISLYLENGWVEGD